MPNVHYCKLSDDCSWCNVPFCPYEKIDGQMTLDEYEEEQRLNDDDDEGW